jgi:hypothetical protein
MVRTLLIWLLVLALPAQGAMAATMAFCGPNHHGSTAAASAPHDGHAVHEDHEHTAQGQAHSVGDPASDTVSAASPASKNLGQADVQKCSVCASCCSATAVWGTVPKLPVVEPATTVFAEVVSVVQPFAADGPDRPPRIVLA